MKKISALPLFTGMSLVEYGLFVIFHPLVIAGQGPKHILRGRLLEKFISQPVIKSSHPVCLLFSNGQNSI